MTQAAKPAPSAHHLLKFIDLQLRAERKSLAWLSEKSGVSYTSIKLAMNGKRSIHILSLEAMLNTLGYSMKATPLKAAA